MGLVVVLFQKSVIILVLSYYSGERCSILLVLHLFFCSLDTPNLVKNTDGIHQNWKKIQIDTHRIQMDTHTK